MEINYDTIALKMKEWKRGIARTLPVEYIQYHEQLAYKALQDLLHSKGCFRQVHRTYMENDGWADAMKVLHVIVELKNGELKKLKWHDSNATGNFMVACKGGGWSSFNPEAA